LLQVDLVRVVDFL
jgi:hypothetical protein